MEADVSVFVNAQGQALLIPHGLFHPAGAMALVVTLGGAGIEVATKAGQRLGTVPDESWPDLASARDWYVGVAARDGGFVTHPVTVEFRVDGPGLPPGPVRAEA